MPRECPGCGATTTPEARFCRRCGVPLKIGGGHDTDSPVSPGAQTIPLVDEGRTTDGLWTEASHELATGTSRIKRAEMEDLLKRVSREHSDGDGHDGHAPLAKTDGSSKDGSAAAPVVTSTLKTPNTDASTIKASPATATARRKWHWLALPILGLLLIAGVLSFIYIRRSKGAGAGEPSTVPVSVDAQPPAVASEGAQPTTEPATQESSPQAAGAAKPAPSARARDTQAEAHPEAPATSPAKSSTTAATDQTAPQAAAAPVLSASERYQRGQQLWESGNRRAALEEFRAAAAGGVADAYYYLGSEYFAEGRDPKTLSDGELRAALNYFLRATAGPHSAQASRSAQLLGREYERRKKQSRP